MCDDSDAMDAVRRLVWSGFYAPDEIEEIVGEELFEPEGIDGEWLRKEIDRHVTAKKAEEDHWPDVTDCDRLDGVFETLRRQGIIALQNAGYTQSDGLDDLTEVYEDAGDGRAGIKGYCFFHGQDLERVVDGGELFLAFGDIAGDDARGLEIGHQIKRDLEAAGFLVAWDGSIKQRILVKKIRWQRRSSVI